MNISCKVKSEEPKVRSETTKALYIDDTLNLEVCKEPKKKKLRRSRAAAKPSRV